MITTLLTLDNKNYEYYRRKVKEEHGLVIVIDIYEYILLAKLVTYYLLKKSKHSPKTFIKSYTETME